MTIEKLMRALFPDRSQRPAPDSTNHSMPDAMRLINRGEQFQLTVDQVIYAGECVWSSKNASPGSGPCYPITIFASSIQSVDSGDKLGREVQLRLAYRAKELFESRNPDASARIHMEE